MIRGIEALCLRESMATSKCIMRWVHPEAMPAYGLTNSVPSDQRVLMDFLVDTGAWSRIPPSSPQISARKLGREASSTK